MQPDDGYDVHHRNGNKLDCRRNNLETITHAGHAELYYGAYARGWQEYVEREYGI